MSYIKSEIIPTIQGDKLIQGLQIKASWRYLETGGSNATIKAYGVNSTGETLLGTGTMDNDNTNVKSNIFQYLNYGDYIGIRWEFNGDGTTCKLHDAEFIGYILDAPEETSSDSVTATS